jgi:hypothetical protein
MDNLGDAAVPQLVRLAEILDKKTGTDISKVEYNFEDESMYYLLAKSLQRRALDMKQDESGVFSFTIAKYKAEKALETTSLIEEK